MVSATSTPGEWNHHPHSDMSLSEGRRASYLEEVCFFLESGSGSEIWNRDSQNMGCSWWPCHCTPVLIITPESFKYRKTSQPVSGQDGGREVESKHTG